ncbi:MAG: hypothetical protein A2504_07160 [Bdellovibrionales bacterium RIFOXYD12_FULL_39_22]|nr:MAG: hypothetical protein A2385_05375 [Bdellovibrionales bacterium RIFOXYB1_FULL_39_21]OFZ44363.1 MAG: hypothetical protein A2485_16155 [Bdellovibrionales bacterium RIFOXYC12_FULL_39_17]OFZ49217.1 MAG: hypothetical protein A2404_16095 [Bdellovibrionales bacterium RIFOXYC1_FULL_39_130]OFZ77025.1 MAG: hypothetical protein A2560_11180 [Bdellovibrionales bacterium RIFOXYD1_FULL_39_84]OFZ95239.1 MAG: hypothetical protein A2504_07160 [Bdellovibrionales bacterium RIFOXYD12_FULL_39_22]
MYVHAKPGSKQEKIIPDSDGNLIIHTHARPIDGQANEAIRVIIAKYFRLSKSCVEVTRGEKSRYKHVIVTIFFTDSKDLAYYLET